MHQTLRQQMVVIQEYLLSQVTVYFAEYLLGLGLSKETLTLLSLGQKLCLYQKL